MPAQVSRLFSWLNEWRPDELTGELVDIFIASSAGAEMRRVAEAVCLPGRGLSGDRYATGQGHWIKTDGCELTLITHEDLVRAEKHGVRFGDGQHRRNLVVRGIPLAAFHRRQVRVGEALFAFHRLRPPCAYIDRIVQPGTAKALGRGAGIGLHVVEAGTIRVGDTVEVLSSTLR